MTSEAQDGPGEAPQDAQVDIRILRGEPTIDELAAVSAVLTAALDEIAGEQRRRHSTAPSAWQRSQRSVRSPLVRGAWSTSSR